MIIANVSLQESSRSLGVRMALGETQIVAETRQFLLDNGVALDSFSQVQYNIFVTTQFVWCLSNLKLFKVAAPSLKLKGIV